MPDESSAARWAAEVRESPPPWLVDIVPAYLTVAVFFNPHLIQFREAFDWLSQIADAPETTTVPAGRHHVIPCCYDRQLDLQRVAQHCGLTTNQVIELHTSQDFSVYAIGFCPGFPYLGYLPTELAGVPRLESPRLQVDPGSVGLTGRQTGIYPLARPGGWNIIGQTPLTIVDLKTGYFPLQVGDSVRFQPISRREFDQLTGQKL